MKEKNEERKEEEEREKTPERSLFTPFFYLHKKKEILLQKY